MGTHIIPPSPYPPQYISANQVNQFQQQHQHYDIATQISSVTSGGSIMGGRNKKSSLQSPNKNFQVQNLFSKQRIRRATAVSETVPNTYANNEANTYAYFFSLVITSSQFNTPIAQLMCKYIAMQMSHL